MQIAAVVAVVISVACITVKMPEFGAAPTPLPAPTALPEPAWLSGTAGTEASPRPPAALPVRPPPPEDQVEEWIVWGGGAAAVLYGAVGIWMRRRARRLAANALAREPP